MSQLEGLIIKAISGFYYVKVQEQIFRCRAKGIFRKENISPMVGDRVIIEVNSFEKENINLNDGSVIKIFERKNQLTRPVVANIDQLIIVTSCLEPKPNTMLLDKLLAIAYFKKIEPILIFSKVDLQIPQELINIYSETGIKTLLFSKFSSEKYIDKIKETLDNKFSVFTGNSGVGKSSILNAIEPEFNLKTDRISKKLSRGKHTTRDIQILNFDKNTMLADTPGFSSLQIAQYANIKPEELANCFIEFRPFISECKFNSCSHTCETGCALINALNQQQIAETRYKNYVTLYNEIKKG